MGALPNELISDLALLSDSNKNYLLGVADGLRFQRNDAVQVENRGSRHEAGTNDNKTDGEVGRKA